MILPFLRVMLSGIFSVVQMQNSWGFLCFSLHNAHWLWDCCAMNQQMGIFWQVHSQAQNKILGWEFLYTLITLNSLKNSQPTKPAFPNFQIAVLFCLAILRRCFLSWDSTATAGEYRASFPWRRLTKTQAFIAFFRAQNFLMYHNNQELQTGLQIYIIECFLVQFNKLKIVIIFFCIFFSLFSNPLLCWILPKANTKLNYRKNVSEKNDNLLWIL